MDNEQQQQPSRHLYFFSLRWSTYTAIAATVFMGCIIPTTRLFATILILGYLGYTVADTLSIFSQHEQNHRDLKRSLRWAIITNAQDYVYFIIALLVGLFLGLGI